MDVRHEFIINGLRCAGCANKIEDKLSKMEGLKEVKVNFAAKKLSFETGKKDLKVLLADIGRIADGIEPGVTFHAKGCSEREGHSPGNSGKKTFKYAALASGVVIFASALVFNFSGMINIAFYLAAYLLVGGEVLLTLAKNIVKGEVFDENCLMSVATIGAFAIGEYPEAVAVMIFYQIGMFFEDMAVEKSRKSITDLMDIRPDFANVKKGDEVIKVSPQEVNADDIIIVKPGEKVPLDGIVIDGNSALDTSALTGESLPRDVEKGSEVLSGSINKNGLLSVRVTKSFSQSTVSKILNLVENASGSKSRTENFITKFAKYYTPAVVFSAMTLAVIPPLIFKEALFADWLYRALVFLVVSCPCALVVSIPLSFFGAIGGASKNGVLVKGSNYLEALNGADTFVFDKTGTLTKGVFKVVKVIADNSFTREDVLEYAAYAESYSNHPIAVSIRKAYGKAVDKSKIDNYEELAGLGISANVGGKKILAGNTKLLNGEDVIHKLYEETGSLVYVSIDGIFAGCVVVSDEIKPDSRHTIDSLKNMGINKIVMLTGDVEDAGAKVAKELGIDEFYANLLPAHKIEKVEEIKKSKNSKGNLVFIGDGINDAPVLAGADVGMAMGAIGSDAAIEAADIVLMTDEPSKIITALKIAKKTKAIVWQNIIFALGVKAVVLALGAAGAASMWEAVFADVGVALIAVLNSMRAMKTEKN
jgi:Cd2+/Zn2+-exporting ATPase